MTNPTKQEIRQHFRQWRQNVSQEYLATISNNCCNSLAYLLPLLGGKTIAIYCPIANEINIMPLIPELAAKGYTVTLPAFNNISGEAPLVFKLYQEGKLQSTSHGFLEPNNNTVITPDIIVVPALAVDHRGNRIGYGKGHYDQTLSCLKKQKHSFTTIACLFPEQLIASLPSEPHDQLIDLIVS